MAHSTRVEEELNRLGAELILPLLDDKQLRGFFVLGAKLSADPYFGDDVDLLTTLASQAVIAVKNAQLYSQIVLVEDEKRRAERLAAVGALAAGIAHEIKNPLVAIKTFAELLPERFTDEEFRGDFAQVVISEIERIDDLVARLRGLGARPAQKLTPLDIRGPIDETLALLRGQLEQAQIRVVVNGEPNLPLMLGDAAQLKQLFLNIFINSLEAMSSGGCLMIRVRSGRDGKGPVLSVEIQDDGAGVPGDIAARIFEPFVTSKSQGSGLGLSICRGIAEEHNGAIAIQTGTGGKGTVVVVEFPLLDAVAHADYLGIMPARH